MRRKTAVVSVLAALTGLVALVFGSIGGASGSASSALSSAIKHTQAAEHGTNHTPDTTKRAVAKGKHVFVISSGQAVDSSKVPSNGAMAAGKKLGWNMTLLDTELNPSEWAPKVSAAIAQGADGIILDAIDCPGVKGPLTQAKAKGIPVIPIYAFDCNDPVAGKKSDKPLFAGCVNYGYTCSNLANFTKSYGADQANYVIANTKNKAKVLLVNDNEFTVLKYTAQGFADTIKKSGGSTIADTLNFTVDQLKKGQLEGLVKSRLLADKSKGINWVKSPYESATQVGISQAVGGKLNVMGGEGFPAELALLKNHGIQAANVINSEWTGWAAIDALNSALTKSKTHASGIGWTIVDKAHSKVQNVDFKGAYAKAWGK